MSRYASGRRIASVVLACGYGLAGLPVVALAILIGVAVARPSVALPFLSPVSIVPIFVMVATGLAITLFGYMSLAIFDIAERQPEN